MKFHLGFEPLPSSHKITHQDELLMTGSCFSEHIGNKLIDLKFKLKSNPFGIVFNPKSIETSLLRILNKHYFSVEDVFERDGFWYCLEAHSSVKAETAQQLIEQLNITIDNWHDKLKSATWLAITFGSAYAYKHIQQNKIVANCHKLPQIFFEKQLCSVTDIVSDYCQLFQKIRAINPHLHILLTVSPVKHLRDGVVENSLSKAILIQAVHQIINNQPKCYYFPAYEIVNDDLRDYRFYESDMAHPNKQAIDYVWKRFEEVYFNDITLAINERINQIHQAYHHKLFNETTLSAEKFKHKFYQKCVTLQAEYAYIDLSKEIHYFNSFED